MQNKEKQGIFPVVNSAIQGIASKSMEMFNKTADELEENCKLSEKGRALMHQTRLAICAAEKGAGQLGTAIMNNEYVSNGSIWLSGVVDRASKYATARKQKWASFSIWKGIELFWLHDHSFSKPCVINYFYYTVLM